MSSEGLVTPTLEQPSPVVPSHASVPYTEYVTGSSEFSEREETIAATSKEAEENYQVKAARLYVGRCVARYALSFHLSLPNYTDHFSYYRSMCCMYRLSER